MAPESHLHAAAHRMALDESTGEVVQALAGFGISAILLKGQAIANRLYEDPRQRAFGDIDLLAEPSAVSAAGRVLVGLGFRELMPDARPEELSSHAQV